MITVVCGEDTVASRDYYFELKKKYRKVDIETAEINPGQIQEVNKWLADSFSLFSSKKVFFTQNLNRKIGRRGDTIFRNIESLIKNKYVQLVNWEEGKSSKELKFPQGALIKEFKPNQTIFKLIDSCYPGNFKVFISQLNNLPEKTEDGFVFYMICRQIRNLIIVKSGKKPSKMLDWQYWKLKKLAQLWTVDKLITFYEGLQRIDTITKTGKNPFSIISSIDILTYHIIR